MRIFGVAAFMAAALSAVPAVAQSIPPRATAATLIRICGESQTACMTYVTGSLDAFTAVMTSLGRPSTICIPPTINNALLMQIALTYMRAHPESADINAAQMAIAAIHQTYPCPRQPGR